MEKTEENILTLGCLSLIISLIIYFILALVIMLLWNYIIPIFWVSAPLLTYWQSFAIVMLIKIIKSIL